MTNNVKATVPGRISDDPVSAAKKPLRLLFEVCGFPPQPGVQTTEVTNWDFFRGVVLSTDIANASVQRVWGSAVMVAPGIALAARHVLDPELKHLAIGKAESLFSGITSHGAQLWRPDYFTPCANTDICIVTMTAASELPPDNTYHLPAISTRIPEDGEQIMVLGFVSNEEEFRIADRGIDWDGRFIMACGKVTDYLPGGTGAQKPWPMIATDIESLGGMSGGPAFDKDGKLIGLLCSGSGEGDTAYSLISLIWPCFVNTFPLTWMRLHGAERSNLVELTRAGFCFIDNPNAISSVTDAEGNGFWKLGN